MEAIWQFIQGIFPFISAHKYVFLYLGSTIEGLNTMVLGGFLVSAGKVELWKVFLVCVLGYTTNGYLWYLVGYFAGSKPIDRWGRNEEKSRKIIEKVEYYFHRYSGRAIILTKFTFSLTIATMIMAGSLKYNLKKFSFYNFIGSLGWVISTMAIGYFFGQSYQYFFVYLQNLTFLGLFLAGAIFLVFLLKKLLASAFIKSLYFSEKVQKMGVILRGKIDKIISAEEDERL